MPHKICSSACVALIISAGFGNSGELARTELNSDGKYDLRPSKTYKEDDGNVDYKFVLDHFMTPKLALFQEPRLNRTITSVCAGDAFLMVSARDPGEMQSKLYSCGANHVGQLGQGDPKDVGAEFHRLTLVQGLAHESIAQMAGGMHFALLLTHDGKRLYATGRSHAGQLGRGLAGKDGFEPTPKPVLLPERYKDIETEGLIFTKIVAGEATSFAVDCLHRLYTWGYNDMGQAGHDATKAENDVYFPTRLDLVPHLRMQDGVTDRVDVHAVSSGGQHTLVACRRYKN
jgi:alpha-tubulin suppressor-like RCC1 family protein